MRQSKAMRLGLVLAMFISAFVAAALAQSFWELRHPVLYDLADRSSFVPSTGLQWMTSFAAAVVAAAAALWLTRSRSRKHEELAV